MTDPATQPARDPAAAAADQAAEPGTTADPTAKPMFEQRMEGFGREAQAAGERLGREAQAAGERWSKDPSVVGAADTAGRVWGLVILAVGVWFLADVTFGLDMPTIAWRDLWPLALIIIGLAVVIRGMARRRT